MISHDLPAQFMDDARELIIEALTNWQPLKSNDITLYCSQGRRPKHLNADERDRDPFSVNGTRRKGTAKLNCSGNVYEHLRVQRTISALPSHLAKWLLYRYGDDDTRGLLPDMVEIIMKDIPLPKQARSQKRVEQLVTRRLMNAREFNDLRMKELFEAMGISKQVFFRRYSSHNEQLNERLSALDKHAISEFYSRHFSSDMTLDHAFDITK
ncbi:hypothetical protein KCG43_20185 [Photobacterium sp. WH24]|uniref:hypothetical protein n=1 Tax=Photobacterium sp. WH24 TaxID=2827237 RepID=UPI001C47748A|nr:hypothetical protein [Photobacterium sp. WH24]MBV7264334.1 hypothetical protein [Photobacterium sp. WH24]